MCGVLLYFTTSPTGLLRAQPPVAMKKWFALQNEYLSTLFSIRKTA
jgi:hypothetical protein